MHRLRTCATACFLAAAAAVVLCAPCLGQAGEKPPSEQIQEMFREMHVTLSCIQLELTEEQANLIIENAPGVRARRQALELRHEEQLRPLLPQLQRAVQLVRQGQIQQAMNLAEQVRQKIELIEEDLKAGLAGLADSLKPIYLKLTQKQRAEVFDEFFPRPGTARALDQFMQNSPEQRDKLKADFVVYLVQQSATQDAQGNEVVADAQKLLEIFSKAARLSAEEYKAQRNALIDEIVALLPKGEGVQRSALQAFVDFMSTPDLELIVQRVQRQQKAGKGGAGQ